MHINNLAQAKAQPVFILPGALNACAEDVGQALVELLLQTSKKNGVPGPVFVIDGAGLVDLRETIAEKMHNRAFLLEEQLSPPDFVQRANLLHQNGWSVIGEGTATAPTLASPLFVEVDGDQLLNGSPASLRVPFRLGILVACRDSRALLTFASHYDGTSLCFVQAHADDSSLTKLVSELLDRPGMQTTISTSPVTTAWSNRP